MLAAAVLSAAACTISCFSPLRNPCRVRNGRQFRHEPYMASVIPSPLKIETPSARQAREVAEETAQAILAQQQQEMIANFYSSMDSVVTASETSEESAAAAAPFDPSASSQTVTSSSSSVPPANAAGERFVIVQFKHETCMYRAPFRVAVGDVVVVEADRGENIGTVMELCTALPTYDVPNRVARRANLEEQRSLANLRTQETRITVDVQKAAESVGLGIRVVDTEFQTDMNKLTVYFSSRAPVDFRKLQRTLFREYRCRIWLVNWSEVEFRKRQADRCLGISICSKLGSRLSSVKQSASAAGSRRQSQ